MNVHAVSCKQEGVDCSSADYRVSVYYCLKIGFHEEFHTMYLYSVCDCNTRDVLWLFLVVPLLYFASLPVHTKLTDTVYAWQSGSMHELVTFSLVVVTLLPVLFFSILEAGSPESPLVAYIIFPLWLFYLCALMLYSGEILIPVIVVIILGGTAYGLVTLFKKWEITHVRPYVIWVLYLVAVFLGALLYGPFHY